MTKNKRPPDASKVAREIVDKVFGLRSASAWGRELGRIGGRKGGVNRAKVLSAERRSEIAKAGAAARWYKPINPLATVHHDIPHL